MKTIKIIAILLLFVILSCLMLGCDRKPESCSHDDRLVKPVVTVYCAGCGELLYGNPSMIWPEVFTNPDFEYDANAPHCEALALADGLSGWGLCEAGNRPPPNFGAGMVKVGKALKLMPTPDVLMAISLGE